MTLKKDHALHLVSLTVVRARYGGRVFDLFWLNFRRLLIFKYLLRVRECHTGRLRANDH